MLRNSTRVLYYHIIAQRLPEIYPYGISPKRFENQIIRFKKLGYRFIPLSQAIANPAGYTEKTICLTMDDGFACNYDALMPLMKKHGLSPTLFLVGKCINNRALAWNHKLILIKNRSPREVINKHLASLMPSLSLSNLFSVIGMAEKDQVVDELWKLCLPFGQEEYLANHQPFYSKAQLAELVDCGAELGLHSHTHPDFSRLSYIEAKQELQDNIQTFEELGLPYQRLFAYPYGRTASFATEEALRQELALTGCLGILYAIGDNKDSALRWQRQNLERSPLLNMVEVFIAPLVRAIRNKR